MTIEAHSAVATGVGSGLGEAVARDLAQHAIRVCTVAQGLFQTPRVQQLPESVRQSLAASLPFPPGLGRPGGLAAPALHDLTHGHLKGELIRLDGALRMAPR